jgi:hypothetical protein
MENKERVPIEKYFKNDKVDKKKVSIFSYKTIY